MAAPPMPHMLSSTMAGFDQDMLFSHSGPRTWNHPRTVLTSPYFGFKTQIHKIALATVGTIWGR